MTKIRFYSTMVVNGKIDVFADANDRQAVERLAQDYAKAFGNRTGVGVCGIIRPKGGK